MKSKAETAMPIISRQEKDRGLKGTHTAASVEKGPIEDGVLKA